VQLAIGVDVENPSVLVEGFSELSSLVVVEPVNLKLNNPNNLVIVVCSRGHDRPPVI
jgi:hypothetical protein